jgi:HEAT repeat protein
MTWVEMHQMLGTRMIMQRLIYFALVTACCLPLGSVGAQQVDVNELVEQLDSADRSEARAALDQLLHKGAAAAEAVPALIVLLENPDPQVAVYAAMALGGIGKPAESATEALLAAAFDEHIAVRRAALRAVKAIRPEPDLVQPVLERILAEGDPAVILPALETFAESAEKGVPRLREFLKKPEIAYWGVVLAGELGPAAAPAVPELTALLDTPQHELRIKTLVALGEIGPESAPAVPVIVQRLKSDEIMGARYAAAFALGRIREKSDEVNRALVDAARGDDPILKTLSLWALAEINPDQERVVRFAAENIVANLAAEDPQLRSVAARALADFEDHTDMIGPPLIALLKDAEPAVVGNALDALASIGPKVISGIGNALKNPELRHFATRLLYRMGSEAAEAVPALVAALQEEVTDADDAAFRAETQLALAAIGRAAAPAVDELIKSLGSQDEQIRNTACYALGKIGAEAAGATDELQRCLQDLESSDHGPVLWALLRIQPDDEEIVKMAVPRLIAALDQPNPIARAEAAATLGELGQYAQPALERLKQLRDDPNPMVRGAATEAVQKLEAGNGS